MATASPVQDSRGPLPATRRITRWYIAAAALFIVLGMFAIIEPGVAALAVSRLVGWLLVFGGLVYLIRAGTVRRVKEVILQLAVGIIYLVGGRYSLMHPHLAMGTLTRLLGALIMAGGVVEVVSYLRLKSDDASGWVLFQRNRRDYSRRDDLVSLSFEFRLGHWNFAWNRTFDDRYDAADVRSHSAKARQAGCEVAYEVQF